VHNIRTDLHEFFGQEIHAGSMSAPDAVDGSSTDA
jgi:hypothetical protein